MEIPQWSQVNITGRLKSRWMTLWAHGRMYVQPDWQSHYRSNLASAWYEILDIRDITRNTIVSYFFFYFILFYIFCCLGNRISLVPKVQAYVKSKCLDQMCICAEAGQLGLVPTRPLSQLGLGSTRRSQLGLFIFLMMNQTIIYVPNKKFGRYDMEYAR